MCVRACLCILSAAPQLRCVNCGEENPKWVYCSEEVGLQHPPPQPPPSVTTTVTTSCSPSPCYCILALATVVGEDAD